MVKTLNTENIEQEVTAIISIVIATFLNAENAPYNKDIAETGVYLVFERA